MRDPLHVVLQHMGILSMARLRATCRKLHCTVTRNARYAKWSVTARQLWELFNGKFQVPKWAKYCIQQCASEYELFFWLFARAPGELHRYFLRAALRIPLDSLVRTYIIEPEDKWDPDFFSVEQLRANAYDGDVKECVRSLLAVDRNTYFYDVLKTNHLMAIEYVLEHTYTQEWSAAAYIACKTGNVSLFRRAAAKEYVGKIGLFSAAVRSGCAELVVLLMDMYAKNSVGSVGFLPKIDGATDGLHILQSRNEICKWDLQNTLHRALEYGHFKTAEWLIEHSDLDVQRALTHACQNVLHGISIEMIQWLLSKGAVISKRGIREPQQYLPSVYAFLKNNCTEG